jgi:hypothetical protein
VEHNAHRRRQIRRKARDNVLERLDSSRGSADYHEPPAGLAFEVGYFGHV